MCLDWPDETWKLLILNSHLARQDPRQASNTEHKE